MSEHRESPGVFRQSTRQFEDEAAKICRLYGINPLLGRLYAVLFASPEPLSLAQLCERIGTAKSTTSVVLRRLLSLRLVRRLPPRSDRRDYYEVVSDLWRVLRDWNQMWFQPEIAMWQRSGAELERALQAADAPGPEGREVLLQRLAMIKEVISLLTQVLGMLPVADKAGAAPASAVTIAIDEDVS